MEQHLSHDYQDKLDNFKQNYKRLLYEQWNDYNFLDEIQAFNSHIKSYYPKPENYEPRKNLFANLEQLLDSISEYMVLGQIWQIGGAKNGHYDQKSEPYVLPLSERTPLMPFLLEDLLEIVAPEMTLVQYRDMLKKIPISIHESSRGDYYDNYVLYEMKSIGLKPVFDYLYECRLLADDKISYSKTKKM